MSIESKSFPLLTTTCFLVATAVVGRNIVPAIGCKIGNLVIDFIDQQNAITWRKTSHDYWTKAKKDAVRDLTIAAGLILLGISVTSSRELNTIEEKPEKKESYTEVIVKGVYEKTIHPVLNKTVDAFAWALQNKAPLIDGLTLSIVGYIANYARKRFLFGDPIRDFYRLRETERFINCADPDDYDGIVKGWYFICKPGDISDNYRRRLDAHRRRLDAELV